MYITLNENMIIKRDALSISLEPKINCHNINQIDDVSFSAINDTSYEFLKLCNGMRTYADILTILSSIYTDVKQSQLDADFKELLMVLTDLKIVSLRVNRLNEGFRDIITINNKDIVIPKMISFEITNDCQLQCQHCFNSCKAGLEERSYVDLIKTTTLFQKCRELNIQSIFITGGEAMLHPDIEKIVELAADSFNRITIATNGMLIPSNEFCCMIAKSNVVFQVSLDGNENFHNEFRGNICSYQNLYKTIVKLLEYKIEVQVAYTVFSENLKYLEDEVIKFKNLGVKVFNIGALTIQGSAKNTAYKPLALTPFLDLCKMLNERYSSDTFQVGNKQSKDSISYFEESAKHANVCGAGYNVLHITADFKVTPCPSISQLTLGSKADENLFSILDIKNVNRFINFASPTNKRCQGCELECYGCISNMLEVVKDNDCKVYRQISVL